MRRAFGTITELDKGKRYQVFWTENGRRRSHRVSGKRADAERYLAAIEVGVIGASQSTTYSEYWDTVVRPSNAKLAPKTAADYEWLWSILEPKIGNRAISKTTHRWAQSVIDSIPAPRTQEKCRDLWRKVCNMAIYQDGLLQVNPMRGIKTATPDKAEKRIWSVDEVADAMDSIRGIKYEPLIIMSIGCGLRPEECFALDWEDVSFDGGYCIADVDSTLVMVSGKSTFQDRTKTSSSRREAICGGMFSARMRELAEGKSGPLCPSMNGRTSPASIAHNWKAWCARHDVPHVTFENMRSNYKTLAAQAMVPAELVRMQMGHSGVGVTEQHYLVATRPILKAVADMYCSLWNAPDGENRTES